MISIGLIDKIRAVIIISYFYYPCIQIGADGANSKVRSSMKSAYVNFKYDRTAVVAVLKLHEVNM